MPNKTADIVAQSLVKGSFDVFEAMLSISFTHELSATALAGPEQLRAYLEQSPIVMRAQLPGSGGVALLLGVNDTLGLVGSILGERPASLGDEELAMLREIAEPCLGSGMTNLLERFGRGVEQPQDILVGSMDAEDAEELFGWLGAPATGATFTYSGGADFNGAIGFVVFSNELLLLGGESEESAELTQALAGEAQLSEAEMNDILSGFGAEASAPPMPAPPAPAAARSHAKPPANMDMILDIRLVATARLGRVEMPIGELLALGPGSIIDVGHLVDEPVELLVNNKLIARGDVVVVDEKFGLRITEIVSTKERIESMH